MLSFSSSTISRRAQPLASAVGLVLLAGLVLSWASPAQAQQPEHETVFDHLKEDGQIEQLPPSVLREQARRNPGSLTPEQRRRLRAHQRKLAGPTGTARSKARAGGLTFKDPVQTNGAVDWPSADLNFRPNRTPQRAGDVNGDGTNDWIYVYGGVADDRTSALSDRTSKTLLKFGGGGDFSSSYYDELYYRNLQPVGNFVGDQDGEPGPKADAIEIRRNSYRILQGTGSGYSEVATKPALPSRVTAARMAPVDLDGNGYDDIVLPSRTDSTITVLYGASDPANVERRTYTPFYRTEDTFNSFSYATANIDSATTSDDELVRVAGRTDTTATIPQDSLTIAIFDVNGSRELVKDSTFRAAPLDDIQPTLGGVIARVDAEDLRPRIANVDGTGLQEIILQDFRDRFTAVYTEAAGGDTYKNTASPLQAGVVEIGDLNADGRSDFYLPADTSVALGPSSVSDGLTPDATVPTSGSESITLFDFPDTQAGNQLGDINGDEDDEFIATFNGASQLGARFLDFSGGSLSATDFPFDESNYRRQNVLNTLNVGDWNGDGTDDVAFAFQDGRVEIYFGDPTTALSPDLTLTDADTRQFFTAASMATGDFTGNGQRNLAVGWRSDSRTVAVYEAGSGSSPIHTVGITDLGLSSTTSPTSVVENVGDVNADAIDDLAVTVPNAQSASAQAAFLFLGQSSLSGSPDVTIDYSDDGASNRVGSEIEALGDINDDGIDDFAVGDPQRLVSTDQGSGTGGVYVHFGQDAGTPSFGAPDEIITPKPDAQEELFFFSLNMTAGDFNGDGTPDLAVQPAFFRTFSREPVEAIRIHEGGAFFGGAPEQTLFLPGFLESDTQFEFATSSVGELTTIPPKAGSSEDRLMVGTGSGFPTNALVFSPSQATENTITSGTLLRAPDQNDGLGVNNNNLNLSGVSSAVGDLNGDDQLEALLPQPENVNFRSSPAYTYQLGSTGGNVTEAQPVAAETSRFDASRIETGTETGSFRAPRVKVDFSAEGTGAGDVTVGRYAGRPFEAGTVEQENVSSYYVRLTVENAGGGDVIGDSSRVRFDVSALPGVSNPQSVTVYQRETPDAGPFTALPTSYDANADELVVQEVSSPGEFVFASNTESLTRPFATPTRLSATAASDSVTVSWSASADASQYFVYRSTSPIDWAAGPSGVTPFDTTAAGTTALTDTSAEVGTTYYYRVTAAGAEGVESGFSPQSQGTPSVVLGSPSGDDAVTAGDASLVRQFSVGLIDFDQGQRLAGDVSGDGTVNAADASLIQQFVVDLIDVFPADTAKAAGRPALAEVGGALTWGEPAESGAGGTEVPVRLEGDPTNVRSVQLRATYDTSAVSVTGVRTDDLPTGWRAAHDVDETSGTVRVALSGTKPADAGQLAALTLQTTTADRQADLSGEAALYTAAKQSLGSVSMDTAPQNFRVEENYPNPFRKETTIEYALPEQTTVEIAVYDLLGRRVRTLVDGAKDAGQHTVTLQATSLASGTYFYRVRTEQSTETGRMVIVR